jgi:hypothetical protein
MRTNEIRNFLYGKVLQSGKMFGRGDPVNIHPLQRARAVFLIKSDDSTAVLAIHFKETGISAASFSVFIVLQFKPFHYVIKNKSSTGFLKA